MRPILCCFILCCLPSISAGQQPSCPDATAEKATIQTLLAEVRQLRLAVERSASLMPRMQLALTRYQRQQELVDRVDAQLESFRSMMKAHASNKESMAAEIKEIESQPTQLDPVQRSQQEGRKKAIAYELEQQTLREQQERVQELELSTLLQAEKAKLNDLSDQLNALDRKLQVGQ